MHITQSLPSNVAIPPTPPVAAPPPIKTKDSDGDGDHNAPDVRPAENGVGSLLNVKA